MGETKKQPRRADYLVFQSFVSQQEQMDLCQEALLCHEQHKNNDDEASIFCSKPASQSEQSQKLALGIACGANLIPQLPLSAKVMRRAFRAALQDYQEYHQQQQHVSNQKDWRCEQAISTLQTLQNGDDDDDESAKFNTARSPTPLTGLALLYGPKAFMKPHYDAPTQPGQGQEWLACISLGATCVFRCNDALLNLHSGDVLVMDSMAVLHGVEGILPLHGDNQNHLQSNILPPHSRLGILMWQGKKTQSGEDKDNDYSGGWAEIDGIGALFGNDSDSSSDEE